MPGLAFLRKREVLFVSGEKHTDSLGMCGVRHIVNPDRHLSRMKYNELEVALQARTKSSTRWVDYLADAHLFRPKVFVIDHRASPSAHLVGNNYEHFTACAVYWQLCPRRSTRHSCLYLRQHHWRADLAHLVCRRCQPILCSCPPERPLAVRGERDEPAAGGRVRRGLGVSLHARAVEHRADQPPDERRGLALLSG